MAVTTASPTAVTGVRRVCHSDEGARDSSLAERPTSRRHHRRPARRPRRGFRPHRHTAPANPCGQRQSVQGVQHACQPSRRLSPKVIGTACWVSVRPTMIVFRCRSVSSARAAIQRPRSSASWSRADRVEQHQRGVYHILPGLTLVQPLRALIGQSRVQDRQQRNDRVAAHPRHRSRSGPGRRTRATPQSTRPPR